MLLKIFIINILFFLSGEIGHFPFSCYFWLQHAGPQTIFFRYTFF